MSNEFFEEAEEELLALQSIYEDKLSVNDNGNERKVKITIYPATADDSDSQYVCLEVSLTLLSNYPHTSPEILFVMSRGLSDAWRSDLLQKMRHLSQERLGECVLFDLIDMAKDILTSNNIPSCPCSICLMGFHECDDFLKTDCYHYFHSYCMNQYYNHHMEEDVIEKKKTRNHESVPCPVCRVPIALNIERIKEAQHPLNIEESAWDNDVLSRQKKIYEWHYKKQLSNGGLIDLEYEKNKHLMSNIEQNYLNSVENEGVNEITEALEVVDIEQDNNEKNISGASYQPSKTGCNEDAEYDKSQSQPNLKHYKFGTKAIGGKAGNSSIYSKDNKKRVEGYTSSNTKRQQWRKKKNFRDDYGKDHKKTYGNFRQINEGNVNSWRCSEDRSGATKKANRLHNIPKYRQSEKTSNQNNQLQQLKDFGRSQQNSQPGFIKPPPGLPLNRSRVKPPPGFEVSKPIRQSIV